MQIHELNQLPDAPDGTEYLAVDDTQETEKMTIDQIVDPEVITLYRSLGWVKD